MTKEEKKAKRKAYMRDYYQAHKEEIRAYNLTHKEKQAAYYQAHKEEKAASGKVYRLAHKEESKAYDLARKEERKAYYLIHREESKAYTRDYYLTHKEERYIHTLHRRALIRKATIGPIDLQRIMARDRMICGICHKRVAKKDFSLDHIIPLSLGGPHTEDNLQVAHFRCNSSRGAGRLPAQIRLASI